MIGELAVGLVCFAFFSAQLFAPGLPPSGVRATTTHPGEFLKQQAIDAMPNAPPAETYVKILRDAILHIGVEETQVPAMSGLTRIVANCRQITRPYPCQRFRFCPGTAAKRSGAFR